MRISYYLFIALVFLGCGVPKDVYYSDKGKHPGSDRSERRHFSIGEKKEDYYSRNSHNNKKRHSDKNRQKNKDINRGVSHKEHFNRDILDAERPDRSSPQRAPVSYMNYSPPMSINRYEFISQAKKYMGVRYKYGGTTPQGGLDCSGFVMTVFSDFGIKSPRISRDIALYGQEVPLEKARTGDLIFFTGRDHASGIIGHLGIIVKTSPKIEFIHSATTNNIGVIVSELKGYYQQHFVKVMSVLH